MRGLRLTLAICSCLLAPTFAHAQETSAAERTEYLHVLSQDLPQLLQSIAERYEMRATISSSVRGRVKNLRLPAKLTPLLNRLSESFDIEWYIEGDTLNVSRKSEATTKMINLQQVRFSTFQKELAESGIDARRINLQRIGNGSVVSVTASPSLTARLEQIAASLATSQNGTIIMYRYGVAAPMRVATP
jgi:type II secretory pathway component GspD/PulD (secretin)